MRGFLILALIALLPMAVIASVDNDRDEIQQVIATSLPDAAALSIAIGPQRIAIFDTSAIFRHFEVRLTNGGSCAGILYWRMPLVEGHLELCNSYYQVVGDCLPGAIKLQSTDSTARLFPACRP